MMLDQKINEDWQDPRAGSLPLVMVCSAAKLDPPPFRPPGKEQREVWRRPPESLRTYHVSKPQAQFLNKNSLREQ